MGWSQTEVAIMPILKAQQLFAVEVPPACFLPQFCRGGDGHEEFLSTGPVHLLSNDLLDLPNDPETEREVRVDAGRDLANETGSEHQRMTDGLRFAGIFS